MEARGGPHIRLRCQRDRGAECWRQDHQRAMVFDYGERFSSTRGYSFIRSKRKEPALQVEYDFPGSGKYRIACKVQDDMGGEGLWTAEIEVHD